MSTSRIASHAWLIVLVLALGLYWLATARRIARVEALSQIAPWSVDLPARENSSPTGYIHGQRYLFIPGQHQPSYRWIMEAQVAAANGLFRLRHVDDDAQPDGREITRTAPYRWWLIALGWVRSTFTDESLGTAIEQGTLAADPVLFSIMLVVAAFYCVRNFGQSSGIAVIVGGITLFPFSAYFQPGAPDHHSLSWVLALGSVLPLLINASGRTSVQPRWHYMAAGGLGGLGFWNDAISQTPVLLATALGGAALEFLRKKDPSASLTTPWRAWSAIGAITILSASTFEFAPEHLNWSLQSVHPLHALAWWGLGELLLVVNRIARRDYTLYRWPALLLLVCALAAFLAWPLGGYFSGTGSLLAPDYYARELANHPHGGVAGSLALWLSRTGETSAKWALLLPLGLLFLATARLVRNQKDWSAQGHLLLVLVPVVTAGALACIQIRWWNLCDALLLAVLALLFIRKDSVQTHSGWTSCGLAILLLPGWLVGFPSKFPTETAAMITPAEAVSLIARDYSYSLVQRRGNDPLVLLSTPGFSGAAAYYGGFRVAVSGDEQYQEGLLTAVRIASADTDQEISLLLEERRVTHIALPLWDPMLDQLVRIGLNLPEPHPLPASTFAFALRNWDLPPWLRPMDYLIPNQPVYQGRVINSYSVERDQGQELGLCRLAEFFAERGQLLEAKAVREALRAYPRSLIALGAIATVDLALQDSAGFAQTMENLRPLLSRRSARSLPVDRRIGLAVSLVAARQTTLAQEQILQCHQELSSLTLRSLNPGAVINLLVQSRGLNVAFATPSLEAEALKLIPPQVRSSLFPNH